MPATSPWQGTPLCWAVRPFQPAGKTVDGGRVLLDAALLTDAAQWLSATRPPIERAIVDLQGRHGLDRVRFARSLGLSRTAAAIRAAAVAELWAAALDPALLVRLGPGDCDELGIVLAGQNLTRPGNGRPGLDEQEDGDGLGGPAGTSRPAGSPELTRV